MDAVFDPGTGADNTIDVIAIQSDGKIIVAGNFYTYNGTFLSNIARLNTNGSLDAGFNTGTGTNNGIFSAVIQPDGKVLIGGGFTSYNEIGRNRITRLMEASGSSYTHYFRSIITGNWNAPTTWESSPVANFSSGVVSPATLTPDFRAADITVRSLHVVSVTANVTAKKTNVAVNGSLIVNNGVTLTVQ